MLIRPELITNFLRFHTTNCIISARRSLLLLFTMCISINKAQIFLMCKLCVNLNNRYI